VTVFTFTVVFLFRAEGLGPKRLQHEIKLARRAMICKEARNQNVTLIGLINIKGELLNEAVASR
jgi:hypothetical protein